MKHDGVDLVIVGSIGLDSIETKFDKRIDLLGGSVSYACVASSFFAPTGMVGIAGDDFPESYLALYKSFGINLDGLSRVEGKTFRWSGIYDDDMINRRTLSTELNVFSDFTPDLPEHYREAPFLLLGNISPELQLHVLDQLEAPQFVVADTMDLWIETERPTLEKVISQVNMLMLNDEEARLLTGEHNLRRCAKQLLSMGPDYIVIKKGEHGAMLLSNNGIFLVPAYPVDDVVDPTGAGDSFAGGFLGGLAAGGRTDESSVRRALLLGSVVASVGVEGFSLDRFEAMHEHSIQNRLEELEQMMRVDISS